MEKLESFISEILDLSLYDDITIQLLATTSFPIRSNDTYSTHEIIIKNNVVQVELWHDEYEPSYITCIFINDYRVDLYESITMYNIELYKNINSDPPYLPGNYEVYKPNSVCLADFMKSTGKSARK